MKKLFPLLLLSLLLASCFSPAPPPEVSAESLALNDVAIEAVERSIGNQESTNQTWAGREREFRTTAANGVFEARVARKLAESQPATPAAILAEVNYRDKLLAENEAEIQKTLAKLRADENLAVTLEVLRGFKGLFDEMSARDKKVALLKSLWKRGTPPATSPPSPPAPVTPEK